MLVTTKTNKILINSNGVVLEDVPHLTNCLPNLPIHFLFLLPFPSFHILYENHHGVFVY
jgi:hypothetical protein